MCHRISPLLFDELEAALAEQHASGHPRIPKRDNDLRVPDAYPGTQLPLFVPQANGAFKAALLTWGFDNPTPSRKKLIFNTRLETALTHAHTGQGMWATAIAQGRCLVPARAFYEHWTRPEGKRGTQIRFGLEGYEVFLMAGIWHGDRVSVVTTQPNEVVGRYHSRMPLVLAPGESSAWLGPDYAKLADRSHVRLSAAQTSASQS